MNPKKKKSKKKVTWAKSPAKINKHDVGRYVRVWFEDIGHVDGILIYFDRDKKSEPSHRVFLLIEKDDQSVSPSQITWKGDFVSPPPCEK